MKELKLIPPTDPRVQTAIAPCIKNRELVSFL